MTPGVRKLALTTHIASSVGWLGAVAGFLGLALVGLRSDDPDTVRAAYIAMDATSWFALVPFALATLITGIVESFSTKWGLFRHYWVVIKLSITLVATVVLVLYTETLELLADRATTGSGAPVGLPSSSPVLHSAAALVLLLAATGLAVYKPRGVTRYGWRKSLEERPRS
ncbi:MAG TPA: DUF2269 domain-containing protein [Microbacterium sp.]|nr:DUF2269 domain-containing protein [Microbacterium sp.]